MSIIEVSGKKLLARFAWEACAKERLGNNQMLKVDFDELESIMKINADPDSAILTLCFPKPVRKLRAYAKSRVKHMWTYNVVKGFLLQHKGSGGNCTVKLGIVDSISPEYISVIIEGESTPCFNSYRLKLKKGSEVLTHRSIIFKVGW